MPDISGSANTAIEVGDPAPVFSQRTLGHPKFVFDTVAGRYIVLCFFLSAQDESSVPVLNFVRENERLFDDKRVSFFGVTADERDCGSQEIMEKMPGIRFFVDLDLKISKLYRLASPAANNFRDVDLKRRCWLVLDPALRVKKIIPLGEYREVLHYLRALPSPHRHLGLDVPAPILIVPDVFERGMCDELIRRYEEYGGRSSGVMREIDSRTVLVQDVSFKVRKDYHIQEPELVHELQSRIVRRVVPEIYKVHQFRVTRMERYLVSCYASEDGAHFRPHRDNTTKGTAHRRFAVSINLNNDFEGGEVHFPEYSPNGFKVPAGCAVVFSCSLLHAVSQVTAGRRYAFLPFVYDDAAARIRQQNKSFLERPSEGVAPAEDTAAALNSS